MLKGFLVGLVVANGFEWFAHKYVLHGMPRKGQARFSPVPKSMKSHWEHHKVIHKQHFYDHAYVEGLKNWRTRNELMSLGVVAVVFGAGSFKLSKGFTAAVAYSAVNYFYVHRRAHLQPNWGKKALPWHYDHHMNANQDANWCVTKPWFDYIMGTRVVSSADLKEANPLGLKLPKFISQPLSQAIEQIFPVKWVEAKHLSPIVYNKSLRKRVKDLEAA